MSRFFVGHKLAGEEINKYYENITNELANKFGIKNLGKKVAPHLTLKPPFESEKMEEFEKIIKKLAEDQKIIPFEIDGFGKFEYDFGNTIYLAVSDNPELQKNAQKIAYFIKDFGENRNESPNILKLHASVARYMDEKQMKEIWEYLHSKPIPEFNLWFNNLTIFKYSPGSWNVYREFKFLNSNI
jgi:2'-5' RNA ligase